MNTISLICFSLAILHTFMVNQILTWSLRYHEKSLKRTIAHIFSEVELVFGLWAIVLLGAQVILLGTDSTLSQLKLMHFNEPIFVFIILVIAGSKPIIELAIKLIEKLVSLLPFNKNLSFYFITLSIGPLLGSFITEPAAMTVCAIILYEKFYLHSSLKFKYATLGLLFVNISIGGVLTPYASPPILMIAQKWNWDFLFLLKHFGLKAIVSIFISTAIISARFKKEMTTIQMTHALSKSHILNEERPRLKLKFSLENQK